jgi:hypothetical protein
VLNIRSCEKSPRGEKTRQASDAGKKMHMHCGPRVYICTSILTRAKAGEACLAIKGQYNKACRISENAQMFAAQGCQFSLVKKSSKNFFKIKNPRTF